MDRWLWPRPCSRPFNHLAWIMPPLSSFLGIGAAMLIVRKMEAPSRVPLPLSGDGFPANLKSAIASAARLSYEHASRCGHASVAASSDAYVFYPERHVERQRTKTRLDFLREQKDVLYENLRDLNFEYARASIPRKTTPRKARLWKMRRPPCSLRSSSSSGMLPPAHRG